MGVNVNVRVGDCNECKCHDTSLYSRPTHTRVSVSSHILLHSRAYIFAHSLTLFPTIMLTFTHHTRTYIPTPPPTIVSHSHLHSQSHNPNLHDAHVCSLTYKLAHLHSHTFSLCALTTLMLTSSYTPSHNNSVRRYQIERQIYNCLLC